MIKKLFKYYMLIFVLSTCFQANARHVGTLHVVDISPLAPDYYMRQNDYAASRAGVEYAILEFKNDHHDCEFDTNITLETGSFEKLYSVVRNIAATPGKKVAVGFTRSAVARIAARAAAGSDLVGISFSANTTDLRKFGANFVSLALPQDESWQNWNKVIVAGGCTTENTVGVFDSKDAFSENNKNYFLQSGYPHSLSFESQKTITDVTGIISPYQCIYFGMTLTNSKEVLLKIFNSAWHGKIYGVSEWSYYENELLQIAAAKKNQFVKIFTPKLKVYNINENALSVINKISKSVPAVSTFQFADAYNATKIGLDYLCYDRNPYIYDKKRLNGLGLLQEYESIAPSGNYRPVTSIGYKEY